MSVTNGILEANLSILMNFYNIYLRCALSVAYHTISTFMSLKFFLSSHNFCEVYNISLYSGHFSN